MTGLTSTGARSEPAANAFEARVRSLEEAALSELAVRSYETRGRARDEPPCRLRTPFQRDRDRIVHTKAFRRLMHKTQVFIAPEGDHYRTRLTHTLETTGISRGVARALRLNEDLVEAIGLGHDTGHTPFGHAGEDALDEALRARFGRGFRHNEQSHRIALALNLTHEVCDGILTHTGPADPETIEGRIVRLVDRVAYINHDIDDALRAGIIASDDLPAPEIELLGPSGARRIDTLATDIVEHSREAGDIVQSDEVGGAMLRLRKFMFERVYLGAEARSEHERVHRTLRGLFDHYDKHPEEVPESAAGADEIQRITDYIAGMTDRFCIATFKRLTLPEESRL
jgi:dGTPase